MMRNACLFVLVVGMLLTVGWAQDSKDSTETTAKQDKSDPKKDAAKEEKTKQDSPKKDGDKKAADPKKDGDKPKSDEPVVPTKADEPEPEPLSEEEKQAIADFQKLQVEWKNLLGELRALQTKYSVAKTDEERTKIENEYNKLVAKGEALESKVKLAAESAYLAAPKTQRDAERYLASSAAARFQASDYEEAARLAILLAENGYQNSVIFRIAGNASFYISKYDDAEKYLSMAKDYGSLDEEGRQLLPDVSRYKTYWTVEEELRVKEAEADDLPRVLLKTNKGDIVLELFENEAPNTVANFISLVEQGFYKDVVFHRVLSNPPMAQGGCPEGTGTGGPGYSIPDECRQENYRRHFRGSLSMAHAGPDTGGSQFFLCYKPISYLDGKHTVFGRIIKGMDAATNLQRIDPGNPKPGIVPDKILEAKVLRKRDHEYKVTKTGEADPQDPPKKDDGKKAPGKDAGAKDKPQEKKAAKKPADKKKPKSDK